MRAARAVAVATLAVLVSGACAPSPPSGGGAVGPSDPGPSRPAATRDQATAGRPSIPLPAPSPGSLFGPALNIDAPCANSRIEVLPDELIWQACDLARKQPTGQIVAYSFATHETRVLYEARTPGLIAQLVRATARWLVWFEYSSTERATDGVLYAIPRDGGEPVMIQGAIPYAQQAHLAEADLDGETLYWTVPVFEEGRWYGRLMRRQLPDGVPSIVLQAPPGAIITYPSVRYGLVAYEYSLETGTPKTQVRYLTPDGAVHQIDRAPSSEPAVGEGFILFKRSERYELGSISAFLVADRRVIDFGGGEKAQADGRYGAWRTLAPGTKGMYLALPLAGCAINVVDEAGASAPWLGLGAVARNYRDQEPRSREPSRIWAARIGTINC